MTTYDTAQWWNEIWATMDEASPGPDEILRNQVEGLPPGRALDIGCGAGGNAVWLAEQGWQVTAVDYSEVAVEKGKLLASERGTAVDFVVADAASFQPQGRYHLITSFYIQLPPEHRAKMLSNAAEALAPGGALLFVSHDKSSPPQGWAGDDLLTLTTPYEVAFELSDLKIEQAFVLEHGGPEHCASQVHDSEDTHNHESHGLSSTIVRAVRPK